MRPLLFLSSPPRGGLLSVFAVFSLVLLISPPDASAQRMTIESVPAEGYRRGADARTPDRSFAVPATGKAQLRVGLNPFQPPWDEVRDPSPSPPPVDGTDAAPPAEEAPLPGGPLARYSLDQLRVDSVMQSLGQAAVALVITPEGIPYVVREGEAIGNRRGQIVEITMEGVRVLEREKGVYEERVLRPGPKG
jgi:Tfp pilus assembly protein PilP